MVHTTYTHWTSLELTAHLVYQNGTIGTQTSGPSWSMPNLTVWEFFCFVPKYTILVVVKYHISPNKRAGREDRKRTLTLV